MTRDDITAMFARREAAHEAKDVVSLAADYADDAVVYSPMTGVHQGRAAVRQALEIVFSAFADHKRHQEALLIDGDHIAQVLTLEGTNLGGLMGLPPSGKQFRLPAVFLYELRGTQIVRERRIYDFTGMMVQIGVVKAKPA
jgi:steroid delta-isomerase-like uncharacterized protein